MLVEVKDKSDRKERNGKDSDLWSLSYLKDKIGLDSVSLTLHTNRPLSVSFMPLSSSSSSSLSFDEAVHLISVLSDSSSASGPFLTLSQEDKLHLYGLYKQSQKGDIDQVELEDGTSNLEEAKKNDSTQIKGKGIPQPGIFDFVGRSKWYV